MAAWTRGPRPWGPQSQATPGCVCTCLLSCTSVCVNVLGALCTSCRPRSLRWWLVSLLFLQFPHPSHGQQQVPVAVTVCVCARGHLCSRQGLSQPTCGITVGSPGPQCPRESCSLPPPPPLACPPALSLPVTAAWPPFSARNESCLLYLPREVRGPWGLPSTHQHPGASGRPRPQRNRCVPKRVSQDRPACIQTCPRHSSIEVRF